MSKSCDIFKSIQSSNITEEDKRNKILDFLYNECHDENQVQIDDKFDNFVDAIYYIMLDEDGNEYIYDEETYTFDTFYENGVKLHLSPIKKDNYKLMVSYRIPDKLYYPKINSDKYILKDNYKYFVLDFMNEIHLFLYPNPIWDGNSNKCLLDTINPFYYFDWQLYYVNIPFNVGYIIEDISMYLNVNPDSQYYGNVLLLIGTCDNEIMNLYYFENMEIFNEEIDKFKQYYDLNMDNGEEIYNYIEANFKYISGGNTL